MLAFKLSGGSGDRDGYIYARVTYGIVGYNRNTSVIMQYSDFPVPANNVPIAD